MPRFVFDLNYMTDPSLDAWLRWSRSNVAVLIDYLGMEMYKGNNPLESVRGNLKILKKYPSQVRILKGTRDMIRMTFINTRVTFNDLIDREQTAGFAQFCDDIELAYSGDAKRLKCILEYARMSKEQFDRMEHELQGIGTNLQTVEATLDPTDLHEYRKSGVLSIEFKKRILHGILDLTLALHRLHPDIKQLPAQRCNILASHLGRIATAKYLWAIERIRQGSAPMLRPGRVVNDMADMMYVACSTYTSGFMTNDARASSIAAQAHGLIRARA